ncbi:Serine protease, subtilase family (modular protein) [Candidatus Zixiibacteriota bacterium]|nr:Serine protease, subtilase family (modular protein) [candidate division Zixibacteria bacterium]
MIQPRRYLPQVFIFFLILIIISNPAVFANRQSGPYIGINLKPRPIPAKVSSVQVSPDARISGVIVKFKEGSDIRLRENQFISGTGLSLQGVESVLGPFMNGQVKRLMTQSEDRLDRQKDALEISSRRRLADLNLYYKIEVTDPSNAARLADALNKLDVVELAYPEPVPEPASINLLTPDFEPNQDYLFSAPGGVDAKYADTLPGGDGAGVKIIDIEFGWNDTHEDLGQALGKIIVGGGGPDDHGTAVLGEMIATNNGFGVTGIAYGADVGMVSVATLDLASAIMTAIDNLNPGDLILIELHAPGPHYNFQVRSDQKGYVCMEYWQDVFDIVQYAWARGIIVVEAAGNGAEYFDDQTIYGHLFDTTYRNSHAILAGAGAPPSGAYGTDRSRLSFSNFGQRVNLQGYGAGVYTTGYGDLYGSGIINQYYTSSFSGTSSASPIVTGSIACLQGYYKANFGVPLTSDIVRTILNATGSPQQGITSQHIGPRPNLAAAIPSLTTPPSLYTAPIYIDTSVISGTSIDIPAKFYNRSNTYALDFQITGNDSLAKAVRPDWLRTSPASGTISPADSIDITITVDASSLPPSLSGLKGILQIAWNQSGQSLDSIAYIPVFLKVPCTADTTFEALSSNDPGGPVYFWHDIINPANIIPKPSFYNTAQPGAALDDGSAGPFALPFSFRFYDTSYTSYYVGINGAISFTNSEVNVSGYYSGFDIPGAPFSTLVAAFWNDLTIDSLNRGHGNIYRYNSPTNDTVIIEWYRVGNFNSMTDTLTTFELILTKDGNILMQYYNVGTTGLNSTAVIGLDNSECAAEPYVGHGNPPANIVASGEAVRFLQHVPLVMAGDANNNGSINILDVSYIINFLYRGGPPPVPLASADVNCNGATNIIDVSYLISYLYKSGPAPCYYIP